MLHDDLYPALAELTSLVAPPTDPILVDGDWRSFAAVNGFEPPSEWVALLARYGCSSLGGEAVQLRDPFPPDGSFVLCSELERRELRGRIATYDWFPRWPVWPDAGGFLPWADVRDGSGEIGWLTAGAPDDWHVAVLGRGGDGVETPFGTLEYLVHLARRIDDAEFEREGLGWMDDHTSIAYRRAAGPLPNFEPLDVTFAAIPYEPNDGPIPRPAAEARAWLDRAKERFAPTQEAWEQRWAAAQPALDRAAEDGIRISQFGFRGTQRGWTHAMAKLTYPVGAEARAKRALADVAEALGTSVFEVRNLEQQQVWTDLTGGPAS